MTQNQSSRGSWLTQETSGPDEEHELIRKLRTEIAGEEEQICRHVQLLPEVPLHAHVRIVRALDGWIPLDMHFFSDLAISQDSQYLYYLVCALKRPLRSDVFEDIKYLLDRDSTALVGAVASALTQSYDQDQKFVASLLEENRRDPIRIEVLKELYDRGIDNFSDFLLRRYKEISSPSVRFYAAVLLVATARNTDFDRSLPQDDLTDSVREGIDVSGFGAGATDD